MNVFPQVAEMEFHQPLDTTAGNLLYDQLTIGWDN